MAFESTFPQTQMSSAAVALNGEAQLILTGDRDLLALHPFHDIAIASPAEFLAGSID